MAKEAGFPFTIEVDNTGGTPVDISNDVTNHSFATPRAIQDVTGVDSPAMERLHLLADFSATFNGVFNPDLSHGVFSVLDNARTVDLSVSGEDLVVEALFTDYALTRNQDGSLTWTAPAVLSSGLVPTWA